MGNIQIKKYHFYKSAVLEALQNDDPDSLAEYIHNPNEKKSYRPVRETSFLVPDKKRNSLHVAVEYSAFRCVKLLLEPPYSWDPDKPDAHGWTATQLAEAFNNIPLMFCLGCKSRELRHLEPVRADYLNHLITTRLFWPQDLFTGAFLSFHIISLGLTNRARAGMSGNWGTPGRDVELTGQDFALLFELLLSEDPSIYCEDLTPVPMTPLIEWPIRYPLKSSEYLHSTDCDEYPDCLRTYWTTIYRGWSDMLKAYRYTAAIWTFHRFGWNNPKGASPLTLREFCRTEFRRQILKCTKPDVYNTDETIYPNYAQIVNQLNVPDSVKQYLVYRDLWPDLHEGGWTHPRQLRIHRGCYYKHVGKFGVGLRIGHGFIPNLETKVGSAFGDQCSKLR